MKNYYEEFMKDNNLKEDDKILIKSGECKGKKVSVAHYGMIMLGITNLGKLEELEDLELENSIMRGEVEFEKLTNYKEIRFAKALNMMKNNEIVYVKINNEMVKIKMVSAAATDGIFEALTFGEGTKQISSMTDYSYFEEV